MGLERSRAVTVVVVAPPSPPPIREEGVRPDRPKEVRASLVLREATPEEEEVEEDNPVGDTQGGVNCLTPACPPCVYGCVFVPADGISKVSPTSRMSRLALAMCESYI